MYSQFRAQYPNACLTSDLVVAEAGHYVVQAVVTMGGTAMATGLSSAASVEVAEDRARARALMVLGIDIGGHTPSVQLVEQSSKELPPGAPAQLTPAAQPALQNTPEDAWQGDWNWPDSAVGETELGQPIAEELAPSEFAPQEFDSNSASSDYLPHPQKPSAPPPPGLDDAPLSTPQTNGRRKPRSKKTARQKTPANNAPPQPIDLSDIIAATDVELKRLGWSHVQGRQFLEQTYQKRSRQQLTDSELLEFLEYLKVQSETQDPPF